MRERDILSIDWGKAASHQSVTLRRLTSRLMRLTKCRLHKAGCVCKSIPALVTLLAAKRLLEDPRTAM